MARDKIIPYPKREHEAFEKGLRRSFPVWYQNEDEEGMSTLDRVCALLVTVCVGVWIGLAIWWN